MNGLLSLALSNLAMALVIAAAALAADRVARRPALAHALWVLFFLKLLTPPLLPISMTAFMADAVEANVDETVAELLPLPAVDPWPDNAAPADGGAAVQAVVEPVTREVVKGPEAAPAQPLAEGEPAQPAQVPWRDVGAALWLSGSCLWLGVAGLRLWRFRRQLRFACPAARELQEAARSLAEEMEVVCPGVWVLPGAISPMLWVFGRKPRLLVPFGLVERLDEMQWRAVLAHELAHWRRRDHWVRWLELAALTIYWWCPLVWWARRHLREVEEACCDAWVVWLMPAAARGYALALVETLEFMASARTALPPVASGIGHVRLLKRRLTMIMRGTTPRTLTVGGLAVLALAALALPLMPSWAQTQSVGQPRSGQSESQSDSEVAGKLQALKRAQQDIQRLHEELERSREKLERLTRDLNLKMEQFRRQAAEAAGTAAEKKREPTPVARPGQGGFGGGGFGGGGFSGGQGGFGSAGANTPSFPGGGFSGGTGGGGIAGGFGTGGGVRNPGMPPPDVDKRLREVERKLDILIQMMRQGARPGASASGQRTSGNAIVPLVEPAGLQTSPAPTAPREPAAGAPAPVAVP